MWPSPSRTASSCRSSMTPIGSRSTASTAQIRELADKRARRQAPAGRHPGRHIHARQHRLDRLDHHAADHQHARSRHHDPGDDQQAAGGRRDTDGRCHRHAAEMFMCLGFDHRATDGAQAGRSSARSSAGWRQSTRRPPSGRPRGAMRVVVTGGAGFIGRAIVKRWRIAATRSSRSSATRRKPHHIRPALTSP